MTVPLRAPDHVRVRIASHEPPSAKRGSLGLLLDVTLRGILTGAGAGLVAFAGDRAGVGSIAAIGVLALGAALVSWDR